MSSVRRCSSSGAIEEAVSIVGLLPWAAAVELSVMTPVSLSEQPARLFEPIGQCVHFGPGIVKRERGATSRSHAEAREQRHSAMRAGAHGDAETVDDRRNVMGMGPVHGEGDDRSLALRFADQPYRIEGAEPLMRIGAQIV